MSVNFLLSINFTMQITYYLYVNDYAREYLINY